MRRIEWSEDDSLGLPVIDGEHRALVGLCNEFLDATATDATAARLTTILERMLAHSRAHFLTEERLLDRHGYPGLAGHKAEHQRLLVEMETLRQRLAAIDDPSQLSRLAAETADFLYSWLLDHIRTNDRPYRPFLMSLA